MTKRTSFKAAQLYDWLPYINPLLLLYTKIYVADCLSTPSIFLHGNAKCFEIFLKNSREGLIIRGRQITWHKVLMLTDMRKRALSTLFYNQFSRVAVTVKSLPENVSCL